MLGFSSLKMSDVGEFIARCYDDSESFSIERADPIIRVSQEFINTVEDGIAKPGVKLDGRILTFVGSNEKFIYRLDEYEFDTNSYIARWPD